MDIVDYLKILRKNLAVIVCVTIIFVVAAILITWERPVSYQSSCAIEVVGYQVQNQSDVNYFQYDNFYNTQVATTYANNLVGWVAAPSIIAETYKEAGLEMPAVSLKDLGKTFTAKKKADGSSVVDISYSSKNYDQSKAMISTLSNVLKEKIESANVDNASAKFSTVASTPVVVATPKSFGLNSAIAGIFGLFLAASYAFLRESIKR